MPAHTGIEGNEAADSLAELGAKKQNTEYISLHYPSQFSIHGIELSSATQAILYKKLRETDDLSIRQSASTNLDKIRYAIDEISNRRPTDEAIWNSLKSKNLDGNVRNFFWKAIHNAYCIGKFWNHIPNFEMRAECPNCLTLETMDHILTECSCSGQRTIWRLVQHVWSKTSHDWPNPTFGNIFGCGLLLFTKGDKPDIFANRLYQILISESAYLIWKIRCQWRISDNDEHLIPPTPAETRNLWRTMLNKRVQENILSTYPSLLKHAIPPALAYKTW